MQINEMGRPCDCHTAETRQYPRKGDILTKLSPKQVACGVVVVAFGVIATWLLWPRTAFADDRQPPSANNPQPNQKNDLQIFMRGKLQSSNQVLEGLVTEDFALILKGAGELKGISNAAKWRVSKDMMYRQYSTEFQRKVAELEQAATNKKLDAAVLAYTNVTMSCIECHRWVRATLIADSKTVR